MWCYIDMPHCEWAVCGYEGFLVLVSLLYVGLVRFVIRLKYIPVATGTGMYFNLITNRTRPTYNNETNTKKPSYPHTAHSQ